ncbi:MAG: S41 family peptidase [Candidatus Gracilibacteria bacterium]|nr:S41 family peptidase [Candidatus Gracilibacteria bacterium]
MITSLVSSLGDKHSSYFPPKEATDFSDTLRGDFEGIGAVIDENPKGIKIQKVLEGSPAEKGGLKNGDIITMVDTTSLVGFTADEAVQKIRGPKGSKITISYLRGDDENVQKVEIIRDIVLIPSTQEKIFTGSKIGYLEVGFFGEHTTQEFEKSLKNLTNSGAEGIILDFRNNPGGFLDSAVEILSIVLPVDTAAVITRENDARKNQTLYTIGGKFSNTQVPIVMLINEYSASASEIVAGALQDYERAILIGEKTYGKGSVQSPFVLSDGSILKLTIGRWYTPKDRGIDQEGIHPDISIVLKDEDYKNAYDRQLEGAKKVMQELLKSKGDVPKTIESMKNTTF